jgi:hypothetical protein
MWTSSPRICYKKGSVMPDNELTGGRRDGRNGMRARVRRGAVVLTAVAVLTLTASPPAFAAGRGPSHPDASRYHGPAIQLIAVTPSPYDVDGAGGVFNVDLAAVARSAYGNRELSAANGYTPGILPSPPPGIGHPDPFAPGLVVLLSSTPQAAGGPDANLAGVFQLTDVARSHGANEVFADWEVGKPGAFGKGTQVTLTAFIVSGTAPGIVSGLVTSISNVVRVTFTIGN